MNNGYTFDANDVSSLIKEGDYEVIIERAERKVLPSGKEKISIMFRIRSDFEQAYKNKCVFEDIWAEKDHPEFFNRKRLNQLIGTQHIEDGRVFEDVNAVIRFLLGANAIIHVAVIFDDYSGEDKNTISYYKSSKSAPKAIKPSTAVEKKGSEGVSTDDLPF